MKFSVIIPVYNCDKVLPFCIEAILNQTFSDFELLLIDNMSTDNSLSICRNYAEKDGRIRVYEQRSIAGAGPTRNEGIRHCTGDYIVFCDADDYYNNTALEAFASAINIHDPDLVISSYKEFFYDKANTIQTCGNQMTADYMIENIQLIREKYMELKQGAFITAPWAKAYRRDILDNGKVVFPDIKRCQDVVFNLEFYGHIKKLCSISSATYNYQTPDADTYLKKFPMSMFETYITVTNKVTEQLITWDVYDESAKKSLASSFVRDIAILHRLNFKNNWNLTPKERRDFSKKMLNDRDVRKISSTAVNGIANKVIRIMLVFRCKLFIDVFSGITLLYQMLRS